MPDLAKMPPTPGLLSEIDISINEMVSHLEERMKRVKSEDERVRAKLLSFRVVTISHGTPCLHVGMSRLQLVAYTCRSSGGATIKGLKICRSA